MNTRLKTKNFRFPTEEKVECVISTTTSLIKAVAINFACQFEKRLDGKFFACIYGSEEMDSDPLISKAIWRFNGSEHLNAIGLFKVPMDLWKSNAINLTTKSKCL